MFRSAKTSDAFPGIGTLLSAIATSENTPALAVACLAFSIFCLTRAYVAWRREGDARP